MDPVSARREYRAHGIDMADLAPRPLDQFTAWYDEVSPHLGDDPNAMVVATSDAGTGRPSVRNVLLKGIDRERFVWFTNYESRKGRELTTNAQASLLFSWPVLARQVVVEGFVERLDEAASDAYFASRARGSQLSAWASAQSREIDDRSVLDRAVAEADERYSGVEVPRPPHWGGFALLPDRFEFWQGRENRLHDRIEYRPDPIGWRRARLAP